MATTTTIVKSCPVTGSFCWKNPLHLVAFFAVLPFALKGVAHVWSSLIGAVDTLTK
jgi:hypothetical protein